MGKRIVSVQVEVETCVCHGCGVEHVPIICAVDLPPTIRYGTELQALVDQPQMVATSRTNPPPTWTEIQCTKVGYAADPAERKYFCERCSGDARGQFERLGR